MVADLIVSVIIILIVAGALLYIYKNRKKGVKCIGCPYASSCSGGCGTNSNHTDYAKKDK